MTTIRGLLVLLVLAVYAAGCGTTPTAPTTTSVSSVQAVPVKSWPQPHPDGSYGHEDPGYPPAGSQCPPRYETLYNEWNWVCTHGPTDREMPRRGGYPPDWDWQRGDL